MVWWTASVWVCQWECWICVEVHGLGGEWVGEQGTGGLADSTWVDKLGSRWVGETSSPFAARKSQGTASWMGTLQSPAWPAGTCLANCLRLSSPASSRPCRSRSCCVLRACTVTSRRSLVSSAAVSSSSSSVICVRRSLAACSATRRARSSSWTWWGGRVSIGHGGEARVLDLS